MIKATDLAWARFAAPDLDRMERFLTDFGLVRSARTADALYMRGTNADHHIHITHLADEPAFLGMAFKAASLGDLEVLSRAEGASPVESITDGRGAGGYRSPQVSPRDCFRVGENSRLRRATAVGLDFGPRAARAAVERAVARGLPGQAPRPFRGQLCRLPGSDEFLQGAIRLSHPTSASPGRAGRTGRRLNRVDRGKECVESAPPSERPVGETGLGHIA